MKYIYSFFIALSFFVISCGGSKLPSYLQDELANEAKEKALKEINELSQKKKSVDPIQTKYSKIIEVEPDQITNVSLYQFIDKWMDTPYLMGGENKRGIDCSFFSQFLFHDVYNKLIERTAEKQYTAPNTEKFTGLEYLKEGDLLFFNLTGSQLAPITHVGVYLQNGKFAHSTSRRTKKGNNGVQISNINNRHWQRLFVAAGRKSFKNND